MLDTWVQFLGRKDPLEKEMATHFSVLAWRIPGMGEPGGLLSMGSHRVGHDWSDLAAAAACPLSRRCHPTISSSVIPFSSCPQSFPACPTLIGALESHLRVGAVLATCIILGPWKLHWNSCLVAQLCLTLVTPWTVAHSLPCLWDFPGKNTGVGSHFLLQGIFLTHRWNPSLLHWETDSLLLSHQGS